MAPTLPRTELIESHMDFARALAHRLCARLPACVDAEELESDAYLGLLMAADGFDPGRGVTFRTYSARRICHRQCSLLRRRFIPHLYPPSSAPGSPPSSPLAAVDHRGMVAPALCTRNALIEDHMDFARILRH